MKKLFLVLGIFTLGGTAARADITHKMTSSFQLTTNAAATQVERMGSTYTVSGSGVTMAVGDNSGQVGGLGTLTDGVGQGSVATATQTSAGGAFSLSLIHI